MTLTHIFKVTIARLIGASGSSNQYQLGSIRNQLNFVNKVRKYRLLPSIYSYYKTPNYENGGGSVPILHYVV